MVRDFNFLHFRSQNSSLFKPNIFKDIKDHVEKYNRKYIYSRYAIA